MTSHVAHEYVSSNENLKLDNRSRFPFNVAGVCTLWRDILGDFPEYWTDLLILVDNTFPTTISELKLYVDFSKCLSINIKVTRTNPGVGVLVGDVVKYNEIVHTQAVIEVLRPHFRRCKSIHFDVLYDDSLPSVTRDLLPLSPDLQTLILKSVYENGTTQSNQQDSEDGQEVSRADPDIIFLSGKVALEVLNHRSLFTSDRWNRDITISTYSAPLDLELSAPLLSSITEKFNDVAHLTLENLDIPFIDRNIATPVWRPYHLRLVGLKPKFLSFLFKTDLSMVLFISIIDCTLNDNLPFLEAPNCDELELCRVRGDLGIVLAEWDGSALTFNDCDELTNEIIHALTARIEAGRYIDLCRLKVINCLNFTPSVLLGLVVSFGRARGICRVVVSGLTPPLSENDRTELQNLAGILGWEGETL
ncbi:hypothetical protein CPB83DRAFT_856831 [Crepidotus variabilis]|uniref:Uncharacterized protein n=1 Tax=Crepidotus variabilis TaxID=179855 RepID=A0A9P6JN92_9AGAR|nr:hypothetical protein CPB83DRAFT_856831 [Crepidotus variabilis]